MGALLPGVAQVDAGTLQGPGEVLRRKYINNNNTCYYYYHVHYHYYYYHYYH